MSRYEKLKDAVFSVFDSTDWKSKGISTVPDNFVQSETSKYVRLNVIPSGNGVNLTSLAGLLIVDVFTAAGEGPSEYLAIADTLDSFLVGKSVSTDSGSVLQFKSSNLQPVGVDTDNSTLYRVKYTIPFNLFGVN